MSALSVPIDVGAGPPVVILHGLFGQGRNWASIGAAMAEGAEGVAFRVIAPDLRGHGASPWRRPLTYPEMAQDIAELIETTLAPPIDLVGHSMGGKVAMTLALTRPELIRRLVVADIAPVRSEPTVARYVEILRRVELAGIRRRSDLSARLADQIPEAGIRAFLAQCLSVTGGAARWTTDLDGIAQSIEAILEFPDLGADVRFDAPVLVISGARSAYVTADTKLSFDRYFPRVRHLSVKNAGHWVHSDQPAVFVAALRRALSRR